MYDVIIIGSGPAGLMASIEASKNKRVLVIEKNNGPGKKLLITGGGRCNLTNLKDNNLFLDEVNYNKKYLYSCINKFGPNDIYNYFNNNGVLLKEESDNKIFPVSNKSKDILNTLINNSKATFNYNEEVLEIKIYDDYKLVITDICEYKCNNVIIATGGSTFRYTGSTGDNMKFASMLNQPTIDLFACEVGIILNNTFDLAGTSIENVSVKYKKYETNGNLIFTHKGLSGSSIMKISEYLDDNCEIVIDLLPNVSYEELLNKLNNFDKGIVSFYNLFFSKRFSSFLASLFEFKNIKSVNKNKIIDLIKKFTCNVKEKDDFDKAYVTGGGIDMNYIDSKTMESKINKGIYFVGEALDIHGPLGGYNITLALSTGYLAGISIK